VIDLPQGVKEGKKKIKDDPQVSSIRLWVDVGTLPERGSEVEVLRTFCPP